MSEQNKHSDELVDSMRVMAESQKATHELANTVLENYKEQRQRESRWSWLKALLIPLATVVAVLITIHANSDMEYKHQLNLIRQERINVLYNQESQIQAQVDNLHNQHKVIMQSMSNIRAEWSFVERNCKYLNGKSRAETADKLSSLDYSYTTAGFVATSYFDRDIIKDMLEFSKLADVDTHQICGAQQPAMDGLRNLQTLVSHKIIFQIKKLAKKKAAIEANTAALQKSLISNGSSL